MSGRAEQVSAPLPGVARTAPSRCTPAPHRRECNRLRRLAGGSQSSACTIQQISPSRHNGVIVPVQLPVLAQELSTGGTCPACALPPTAAEAS